MPINGLSNIRRIPREGKIRLGEKKVSASGKEYPVQLDYLKVPEAVQAVYGEKPKEIDVMFASDDEEHIFPQYYKLYGSTGLKCKGDGVTSIIMKRGEVIEKKCTPGADECKGCKPMATLRMLLPKVPGFGVFEIVTSSWNSIVNLNSCIDAIKLMTGGRIAFVPLKLRYVEHNAVIQDTKSDKQFQKTVYVLNLSIDETIENFYKRYRLPEPESDPGLALANQKMQALLESKKSSVILDDGDELEEVGEYCQVCNELITDYKATTVEQLVDNSVKLYGMQMCAHCVIKKSKENDSEKS